MFQVHIHTFWKWISVFRYPCPVLPMNQQDGPVLYCKASFSGPLQSDHPGIPCIPFAGAPYRRG